MHRTCAASGGGGGGGGGARVRSSGGGYLLRGGEMAQLPLLLRCGARACSSTAAMASPSLIAAPS